MADFDAYDDWDRDDAGNGDSGAPGDPLAAGVEQFQRAAIDALGAARAMLDAAETVLRQPGAFDQFSSTIAGLAKTATETVLGFTNGMTGSGTPGAGTDDASTDEDDDGGFHSIVID